jgi:hypothetical protein
MASGTNQQAGTAVTSARLSALLDKLVAVDLGLESISRMNGHTASVIASADDIADACDILHSAIADLRNFIHQFDGMMNLQRVASGQVSV